MTALQTAGIVVGIVGGVSGALVPVLFWFFAVTRRLDSISAQITQLLDRGNNHLKLTGLLASRLPFDSETERAELIRHYTALSQIPEAPANPLSPEEQTRLDRYIEMAKRGAVFNQQQVRDYQSLVERLHTEHPKDVSLWPLLGLAALLTGLYLLGRAGDE